MAHLTRLRTDAQWYTGYLPTGADFIALDQGTFVTVNGDEGGTWLPSSTITIGGAGVQIAGPWTISGGNTNATGDVTFDKGTADDCFQFGSGHPERALDVFQPLDSLYANLSEQARVEVGSPLGPTLLNSYTICGVQTLVVGARFMTPIRVRNGARFTTVVFKIQVNEDHLPSIQPRYRVIAVASDGTVLPLRAQDATTSADGFVQQASADHTAYYNGGVRYDALTYTCNQNRVVDVSKYSYFVEIIDESGSTPWATTGTRYVSAMASFDQATLHDGRA